MNFLDYKRFFNIKYFLFLLIVLVFASSCKKNKPDSEIKESSDAAEQTEPSFEFYTPEFDDGQWVNQVIDLTMEEISAEQLESLSEIQSIINSPYSVSSNEVEFVEKRLTDSLNNLKFMEYGEEIFIPKKQDNLLVMVHKYKDSVVRNYLDQDNHLVKKEYWSIKSADDAKKIRTETYSYNQDNKPVTKKIEVENQLCEYYWTYDDKGRLVQENEIIRKDNNYSSKTQIYIYNSNDEIPPSYEYYENGEIKNKMVYSSKKDYWVQTFFEDDFSVITYYEQNLKVREEYLSGEEVVRQKVY